MIISKVLTVSRVLVAPVCALSTDTYDFAAIITEPIPGIKEMETIAHPVQMAFENVPAGHHHLSAVDRSTVLCFAKELI